MSSVPSPAPPADAPTSSSWGMRIVWLFALAALSFVAFCVQLVSTRGSDVPLARLAGQLTVTALFVTLAFFAVNRFLGWLFLGRRRRPASSLRRVVAFAAIFAAMFSGAVLGQRADNRRGSALASIAEDALARFERESADDQGSTVRTTPSAAAAAKSAGEFETPEDVLRYVVARSEANRREYFAELEAIEWDSILDPARLEHDLTLAQSREMVRRAKEIVARQEVRMQDIFAETREHLRALPLSDEERRGMLDGFDDSFVGSDFSELQRLERQTVEQCSELIEVLAKAEHGVGWTIKDGDIAFRDSAAMHAYQAHVEALLQTVAEQERLTAAQLERAKRRIAEMKR